MGGRDHQELRGVQHRRPQRTSHQHAPVADAISEEVPPLIFLAPNVFVLFEIGEINTMPGLHHHALVSETNRAPVGEMVLEHIFRKKGAVR